MPTIDENSLTAASRVTEFLFEEGIVDPDDGVMDSDMMVNHIAGIIRKQFADLASAFTITIDEIKEAEFFNAQHEKLREY